MESWSQPHYIHTGMMNQMQIWASPGPRRELTSADEDRRRHIVTKETTHQQTLMGWSHISVCNSPLSSPQASPSPQSSPWLFLWLTFCDNVSSLCSGCTVGFPLPFGQLIREHSTAALLYSCESVFMLLTVLQNVQHTRYYMLPLAKC